MIVARPVHASVAHSAQRRRPLAAPFPSYSTLVTPASHPPVIVIADQQQQRRFSHEALFTIINDSK